MHCHAIVTTLSHGRPMVLPMRRPIAFYRILAIPACLLWGVHELLALQRSRRALRRHRDVDPALAR